MYNIRKLWRLCIIFDFFALNLKNGFTVIIEYEYRSDRK
jgi:hypothetical protein